MYIIIQKRDQKRWLDTWHSWHLSEKGWWRKKKNTVFAGLFSGQQPRSGWAVHYLRLISHICHFTDCNVRVNETKVGTFCARRVLRYYTQKYQLQICWKKRRFTKFCDADTIISMRRRGLMFIFCFQGGTSFRSCVFVRLWHRLLYAH